MKYITVKTYTPNDNTKERKRFQWTKYFRWN
jgi:hypothetical protein